MDESTPCQHCQEALNALRARIEELEMLLEAEQLRSGTDALTELPNRGSYDRAMVREYAHAMRTGSPLVVAVLDLDRFKQVNDTHGHAIGDHVLQAFAKILKEERRASDFVGRVGGEEFVIILPGTGIDGAQTFLERLRKSVADSLHVPVSNEILCVTVSIGVAQLQDGEDIATFFRRADEALYRAKNEGRNCVSK